VFNPLMLPLVGEECRLKIRIQILSTMNFSSCLSENTFATHNMDVVVVSSVNRRR